MPFSQPYKTYFTKGDLIYGLAPSRTGLMIKFFGADLILSKATDVKFVATTVDHYRGETFWQKISEYDQAYAEEIKGYVPQYNQGSIDEAQERRLARKGVALDFSKDLTGFQEQLGGHAKYGRYMTELKKHGMNETAFAGKVSDVISNSAFRAKSKFGMEWTIKKNEGRDVHSIHSAVHIHFVLDSMDMAAVVTKTHRFEDSNQNVLAQDLPRGKSKPGDDRIRTITHSELRWIYRNRNNPLVQQSVQFWKDKDPCCPPWDNDGETVKLPSGKDVSWKAAWTIYKPSMTHDTII
ncbi:hypothetical protein R0381_002764 [Jeongeupia wiesaeckerbachi]|uniref:hypothetical protein n=1 Tax=Jeongeupia wiesaeckerbachi TaxID=3051218 RepID=UPI003D801B83